MKTDLTIKNIKLATRFPEQTYAELWQAGELLLADTIGNCSKLAQELTAKVSKQGFLDPRTTVGVLSQN